MGQGRPPMDHVPRCQLQELQQPNNRRATVALIDVRAKREYMTGHIDRTIISRS